MSSPDEGEGDGIGVGFEFGAYVWLRVGRFPVEAHTVVDVRTGDDVLVPCPCAPDLIFDASRISSCFFQSDDALVLTLEHDFISCAWAAEPFIVAWVFIFQPILSPQLPRFEGGVAADDDDGLRHGNSSILSTDDELLLPAAPRNVPDFVLFTSSMMSSTPPAPSYHLESILDSTAHTPVGAGAGCFG